MSHTNGGRGSGKRSSPVPDLIRVVDVSEYTTTISHEWWRTVRDRHGVRAAVVQAWGGGYVPGRRNEHFAQHVEGALKAGLGVAAYVWPPRDYEGAFRWIEQSGYKSELAFYAHDIEQGAGVTQRCVEAADQWLGRQSWIYASPSSWREIMGRASQYADHPLWLARYPLSPERLGGNSVWWPRDDADPFGGYAVGAWREARGWQFQGTTAIGGETCDLNLFHDDAFRIQQEGDEDMWLDEFVLDFSGAQHRFPVLQADLTVRQKSLTHRQWIHLSALGLIVPPTLAQGPHKHIGTVVVK
ncbi:hypothetical protein LCGC14_0723000 [marine sediment metagenome]|uniref:Uncharacterized protein n=1 Tax=marine sediment metagenome TaxID=412755 RepID=A0A0F9SX94_9ZZZZ